MTEHTQAQASEREAFERYWIDRQRQRGFGAFLSDKDMLAMPEKRKWELHAWKAGRAALASRSTEPGGEATGEPMRMDAIAIYAAACDVRDWANALGAVLEDRHALIASVERLRAMVVEESIRVAQPTRSELIEECCERIKAADDNTSKHGYMLDSNDCISVLRGTWKAWS